MFQSSNIRVLVLEGDLGSLLSIDAERISLRVIIKCPAVESREDY